MSENSNSCKNLGWVIEQLEAGRVLVSADDPSVKVKLHCGDFVRVIGEWENGLGCLPMKWRDAIRLLMSRAWVLPVMKTDEAIARLGRGKKVAPTSLPDHLAIRYDPVTNRVLCGDSSFLGVNLLHLMKMVKDNDEWREVE